MKKAVKIILICFIALIVIVGAVAAKLFIIGEPVSANQLSYRTEEKDGSVIVYVSTPASAIALKSVKTTVKEDDCVHISCRKVLVSPLYNSGSFSYEMKSPDKIKGIYLAEELIWAQID